HAVLVAVDAAGIDGPFGVANGDDIYGPTSFSTLAEHLGSSPHHGLVGIRVENAALAAKPVSRALLPAADGGLLPDIEAGAAGRAAGAAAGIDGAFGVAIGDDTCGPTSFSTLAEHLGSSPHHGLVGIRVENAALAAKPVNRALLRVADDGLLLDIEEGSVRRD